MANGANNTLSAADITRSVAFIRQSRALVVKLETPLESVQAALSAARAAGVLAILNPAPYSPVPDELLALCDWLIPNEIEATKLTGVQVRDSRDAPEAVTVLRQRSQCAKHPHHPRRKRRVAGHAAQHRGHVPGFKVEAVDTVGAGDTFIGGFVAKLVEGADQMEAVRFGCAAAAIAVTRRGAQASIPSREEVEMFSGQS